MTKHTFRVRKKTTKRKTKKHNRIMKGGAYTDEQTQQLIHLGFTPFFIKIANNGKVGYNILLQNFHSSNKTANEFMKEVYNELDINPEDELTDYESSDDEQNGGKRRHKKTRKNKNKNKK